MHVTMPFGPYRLLIIFQRYQHARGITSALEGGQHFLMWDFDGWEEEAIKDALYGVQGLWNLPSIYLAQTGPINWHAYCFTKVSWPKCLAVLAATPCLDPSFFKMGVIRGYFTLRYTKKRGRAFLSFQKLESSQGNGNVDPRRLGVFVTYMTGKA